MSSGPIKLPRVVVAAPASGAGKTTVATGLMAALSVRGLVVSPHKVGPDYIDPSYHGIAAGRPGRNLDPWLVGQERVAPLLLHGAHTPVPADIAVIEGVMGLFDGAVGRRGFASTAHVAALVQAPVVLVVDASAQSRSVAALVHGFATYDPAVRLGGVVLNRVGSPRHEHELRAALAELAVPVFGAVPRDPDLFTPSRHLGLVPAAERSAEAVAAVTALGVAVAASVDLDGVLALARSAPPVHVAPWEPAAEIGAHAGDFRPTIAVAGGAAFTFGYAETTELLRAAGADVVVVDPLVDAALPAGTRGLVLGGGFPEVYADALAANTSLRADIAALDGPVLAECAGLLYLARELDGVPMCGRLDVAARMTPLLTLGYREAVAATDGVPGAAGTRVRGHEFHRTVCEPGAGERPAWEWDGHREGFAAGGVHASYLHLHWAGVPAMAHRLVQACA